MCRVISNIGLHLNDLNIGILELKLAKRVLDFEIYMENYGILHLDRNRQVGVIVCY